MIFKFKHQGKHVCIDIFEDTSTVLSMAVTIADEFISENPDIYTNQKTDYLVEMAFRRKDDGKVELDIR